MAASIDNVQMYAAAESGSGSGRVEGSTGDNVLFGSAGDDVIDTDNALADTVGVAVYALGGDDTIRLEDGINVNDQIDGGDGNDTLEGHCQVASSGSNSVSPKPITNQAPDADHRAHEGLNYTIKGSHRPTRRREIIMARFK